MSTEPVSKEAVVELLESIARLLELKGENPFKVRAYTNAARVIDTYAGDLALAAREERLTEIPGIGTAIAEKIGTFIASGSLPFYETLRAEFPEKLFELFELPGLGAKKIKALHDQLGVASVEDLARACADGRIAGLPGFGVKTAANLAEAIQKQHSHAGTYLLGAAAADAEALYADLRAEPDVIQVSVAGSYRRRREVVHDLDFIVSTRNPAAVSSFFVKHPLAAAILVHGPTKSSIRLQSGMQADLRVVTNEQYPFALNYFTGSKEHNIVMRGRAIERGWTLNEYRLGPVEGSKAAPLPIPKIEDEHDLYAAVGLPYIEPELRENRGEFAAAENGTLPELIQLENLRGTFHNHTTESDGRASLEEMVGAARDLGLQYLGIADHSKSSVYAHGMDESRLEAQLRAIAKLNESFDDFRIFTGVECDILRDGALDFSDETLSTLDYVVASVHATFSQSETEMTDRIIRAISNPHVTFLGHLTGRLLLTRDAYAVNIPAVIDAAAATGTIIELNANPKRLDMDWRWWPLAKEKGVKCVINPDAHNIRRLQHLWFGAAIARKGWLTRKDVINCLPLGKIEAQLKAKRKRKP